MLGACWDGVLRGGAELTQSIFVKNFVKDIKSLPNVDAEHADRYESKGSYPLVLVGFEETPMSSRP